MNYLLHLLIYLNIYSIVSLSLNLVVGYCGMLTLAHAGYFAIGSYAYALATIKLGWGFFPAMGLGIVVAIILSLAISLPAWRFKGDFFVMISLAVQAFLFSILNNWSSPGYEVGTLKNLTNGPFGITRVPKPDILGVEFDTMGDVFFLSFALVLFCALISWLLFNSPWGRLLKAIRDDELAARGLGKNVRLIKVQVFAISCGMVAGAGAIYASYINYVDPSIASLNESILMLCMVIVGGVGNFRGPLIGALILLFLPEILRFAQIPDVFAANVRLLAYGLLLLVMMHFRPQGIAGEYRIK